MSANLDTIRRWRYHVVVFREPACNVHFPSDRKEFLNMDSELMKNLIINGSLLLTSSLLLSIFYSNSKRANLIVKVLLGLITGAIGIMLMENAVFVKEGIFFDTRSILLSVSGLFLGFIPTLTAVLIVSGFRIFLDGSGAFTGLLVTVLTTGIGLIWHQCRYSIIFNKKRIWLEFYLFGLATHLVMLACMFTLPHDEVFTVLKNISVPVLIIYPIVSLFLCQIINQKFKNIQINSDFEKNDLQFKTIFEQAPIGISIVNGSSVLFVNKVLEKILGRTKEEINELGWKKITHPDDLELDQIQFSQLRTGAINGFSSTKRFVRPDGSIAWTGMIATSLNPGKQAEDSHLCMFQDITEMMSKTEDLRKSETKYKELFLEFEEKQILLTTILNAIPDLIFYKDTECRYTGCNQAFERFVGKKETEIIGLTDFDLFDPEMANLFREMDLLMMQQKSQRRNDEQVTYPDGENVYIETLKTPYDDMAGNTLGLIGIGRDITERKQREKEILYMGFHDSLTGLYNRTFFDEERKRLDQERQLPLSIIIGDINGLKLINDAFGHAEGDNLLIAIAKILRNSCRAEDIIARTGGDEFSVLLPGTDAIQTNAICDRIKKTCEEGSTKSGDDFYYTSISLGYATKTEMNESFDTIMKNAEEYMYRRKLLENKSLHSSIISSIKTTLFEKNYETAEHAERMTRLSKKLGLALDLDEEDLVSLELVSTLHDIGKISIDRNILTKAGELTEDEWREIKKHPSAGYRIAQTVPELRSISEYILCHHERWDGNGYPQGLHGEDIPLLSRILTLVDSYDAMTQDRSYRKALTKEAAIAEIVKNSGTQFDPKVAKVFIEKVLA